MAYSIELARIPLKLTEPAALMLNLCHADWAPRFVDYFDDETRTPAYRQINEMGEVPVLGHKGMRLCQSGVILDYLAAQLGQFGPGDEDERREILRWLLFDNYKLTGYTATLRFMLTFGKTGETPVTEFLRTRSNGALTVFNEWLNTRKFTVANRPTIADFSMFGFLFWPEEIGVNWNKDCPNIARWLNDIAALPGWVHPYELMPGHPQPDQA